jgi:hypothetical protein
LDNRRVVGFVVDSTKTNRGRERRDGGKGKRWRGGAGADKERKESWDEHEGTKDDR